MARALAVALVASTAACRGAATTAPTTPVAIVGTYTLRSAAGSLLPALVHQSVEAETGRAMDVSVTSDTLTISADARYVQHARLEVRVGAQVVGRSAWVDHGTVTRDGSALRFSSDYVQNVTFEGAVGTDGAIHVVQDLPREGTIAPYRFELAP